MKKFKGTKDLLPEEFYRQKEIFDKIRNTLENLSYQEYSTPLLEYKDLYLKKTSKDLIENQSFKIEGKELILRPEITPSLIRMLGNKTFSLPLRMFSIQNMMRNENPQKNRLREFYQINIDLFYNDRELAIVEQIKIINLIFKNLNIDNVSLLINNKKWIKQINQIYQWTDFDKLLKILDKGLKEDITKYIVNFNNKDIFLEFINSSSWKEFNSFLEKYNIKLNDYSLKKELEDISQFSPFIVRGLDYYTGYVFEAFSLESNRAILGGGEYELGTKINNKELFSIGMGIGESSLSSLYNQEKSKLNSNIDYLVTYQDEKFKKFAQEVYFKLSEKNKVVFIDKKLKISKVFKSSDKYKPLNIVFINKEEFDSKTISVKCQKTRQSKIYKFNELD